MARSDSDVEVEVSSESPLDKRRDGGHIQWAAEPMLEKIISVVPGLLYVFNQNTQSNEYTNRSLGEMMGYTAEELRQMRDTFLPTVCHPDDMARIVDYFGQIRRLQDGDVAEIVYRIWHKSGGWRHLLSQDTVFERAPDGSVLRHIGIATDITVQKNAETALQEMNETLSVINRELEELTYVATHDMKSSIVNISGLAAALADVVDPNDDEAHELIALIQRSTSEATNTIQSIVTIAQNRERMETAPASPQDLAASFAEVQRALQPQLDALNATVTTHIPPSLQVIFPPLQLQSVLKNLLHNAIRYHTAARPLVVTLTARPAKDGGVQVWFADNGRGVDLARDRERIFQLFQRGGNHDLEGSGIGLYLVRQMMRRARGAVSVQSTPGGGATFVLGFSGTG
ncbi:MAG: PAS domain-containing sensor histidine kinase [Myxococcota bacterium]